jgi:hypothetical protein
VRIKVKVDEEVKSVDEVKTLEEVVVEINEVVKDEMTEEFKVVEVNPVEVKLKIISVYTLFFKHPLPRPLTSH